MWTVSFGPRQVISSVGQFQIEVNVLPGAA